MILTQLRLQRRLEKAHIADLESISKMTTSGDKPQANMVDDTSIAVSNDVQVYTSTLDSTYT